jgi:hypothetical protein
MNEEIGVSWDHINIVYTDGRFTTGVIDQPKGSAENCKMIVKHYRFFYQKGKE